MILSGSSNTVLALGFGTALAYAWPALRSAGASALARSLLAVAWVLHACLLAVALLGFGGSEARFGFAPALSVTAWLVLTVYAVESMRYPQLRSRAVLGFIGAAAVILALLFPGSALHAQQSVWLPLHWAFGIASYGMFAVAVVHGWLMNRAETQMRHAVAADVGLPLMTLERLMFGFVVAGFVLLSATLLAGWFFGESLYGAAGATWKWNHKTIFSVLSWITFAALLIGRWLWGWRGRRAVRVLYAGAGLLLLAYVGSRFVLEVILRRT
jgi:ABC-type uncharacterized transport system permease subunit